MSAEPSACVGPRPTGVPRQPSDSRLRKGKAPSEGGSIEVQVADDGSNNVSGSFPGLLECLLCRRIDSFGIGSKVFGSIFVNGSAWFKRRDFRYLPGDTRVMSCRPIDKSR